jgi:hypothetical protein
MKHTIFTPAVAVQPLLNRVRHILGLKQDSRYTCRGMVGLTLLIVLMFSPLAFALLQEDAPPNAEGQVPIAENVATPTAVSGIPAMRKIADPADAVPEKPVEKHANPATVGGNRVYDPPVAGNLTSTSPTTSSYYGGTSNPIVDGTTSHSSNNVGSNGGVGVSHSYGNVNPMAYSGPTPPEPVVGKLYPMTNALQLFEMKPFLVYLSERVPECIITVTKRNAILVTGTGKVHEEMKRIMAEIDAIVESKEFKATRELNAEPEMTIKVFKIKHMPVASMLNIIDRLGIDQMLVTAEMYTNSLIARGTAEALAQVAALLEELDTKPANVPPNTAPQGGYSSYYQPYPTPPNTYAPNPMPQQPWGQQQHPVPMQPQPQGGVTTPMPYQQSVPTTQPQQGATQPPQGMNIPLERPPMFQSDSAPSSPSIQTIPSAPMSSMSSSALPSPNMPLNAQPEIHPSNIPSAMPLLQ